MTDWSYAFFKELYFEELKRRDNVFGSIRFHFTAISAGFLAIYFFVEKYPAQPHMLHKIMVGTLIISFLLLVFASWRAVKSQSGDSKGIQYASQLYKYSEDLKAYDKKSGKNIAQKTFESFMTSAYADAADAIMRNHDERLEHRHECNIYITRGFLFLLISLALFAFGTGLS